nr:sorting nexin-17-like [Chrysemys picta bellii]
MAVAERLPEKLGSLSLPHHSALHPVDPGTLAATQGPCWVQGALFGALLAGVGRDRHQPHPPLPQVPTSTGPPGSSPGKAEVKLELAFEYLMSKDRLQWVTITSPQAIMLSICLQSMVDELMVKKSGGSIRKMFRRRANGALRRSDSQQAVKSPPLLDSPDGSREPMLKLSSKLTSVSLRGISHSGSASDLGANDFHGNYAFEGIGDEDL